MDDARVQELEAKVAELSGMVDQLTTGNEPFEARRSSRRGMLKLAGAAAVGTAIAVGGTVGTAAALHQGEDLGVGLVNPTGATANLKTTLNLISPVAGGSALLVQTGTIFDNSDAAFPCAVAAWANLDTHPTGLYAFTDAGVNCSAVEAVGSGPKSVGIRATGGRANVLLAPVGLAGPARADAHLLGELINDSTGTLWLCVAAGTPGVWRKLASSGTAGAFHPISPARVYDSRLAAPTPGKLLSGTPGRVVSVADGRDPSTGAIVPAQQNVVPAGATAIVYNLTVVDTEGSAGGFLSAVPGDAAVLAGSSINWFGPNQIIANGLTSKLDANRQVKVFAGGINGAAANFLIDVNGFYL
jgi:hypothetical protein